MDPASLNVTILPYGERFAQECGILPQSGNFGQFVNPNQVTVVLPSILPQGPAVVTLTHNGLTASAQIMIVPSSIGLFSAGGSYVVQESGSRGMPRPNQLTQPAKPGDTVTLWATGLGSATEATVLLGGRATTSISAGPAPGMAGVDQIQFVVPDDPTIPNDCYVAVQAQAAGIASNTISISKTADGSACQSTIGLMPADLATLDAGGTVQLAQLSVSALIGRTPGRLAYFNGPALHGFVRTESADFTPLGVNAALAAQISGAVVAYDVFFGCSISPVNSSAFARLEVFPYLYDFGTKVTLEGSGGSLDLTAPILPAPFYNGQAVSPVVSDPSQLAAPLFTPGAWTFSGRGGTGSEGSRPVPAFAVPVTLPAEIMAANFSALQTVNRQLDLVVMWNPAGLGEQDVATVRVNRLLEPAVNPLSGVQSGVPTVTCKIPAMSGQLVIPAAMLRNLVPNGLAQPAASISLSVTQRPGHRQTFSIPLSDGSSLPVVFSFSSGEVWQAVVE